MKKLLLINLFILSSTFALAEDLSYDWNQNDKNTDVVFSIGNAGELGTPKVKLTHVTLKVGEEMCVDKKLHTSLKPQKQIKIKSLPLTECFDLRERAKYVDAINLAAGTPKEKPDTIPKIAVVNVDYVDNKGVSTHQTSTFRVSFFPKSHP